RLGSQQSIAPALSAVRERAWRCNGAMPAPPSKSVRALPPCRRLRPELGPRWRFGPALTAIVAPHPDERAVDFVRCLIEGLNVNTHHIVMIHVPRQAHERSKHRSLAPVGNERACKWGCECDLKFMHCHGALGDGDEFDAFNRAPADQAEGLDENTVLIGADR